MNENRTYKPASQLELSLYCLIGEAVCAVQHVEDGLSHSIVLKKTKPKIRAEADKLLKKHHSYTLGRAIDVAKKANLYPGTIQQELHEFLSERNWLIHKSIAQGRDEWDMDLPGEQLFLRIKAITMRAQSLLQQIEEDLIEFSEANGVDMSRVRAEVDKHYLE